MTNFEKWKADMKDKGDNINIALARLRLAVSCADCPASHHCEGVTTFIHCIEAFLNWANERVRDDKEE